MMIPAPLTDKTVFVTGATRGIGAAIVAALHADGARVLGHFGRDADSAKTLLAQYPERLTFLQANLMDPEAIADLWQEAQAVSGKIDVLVNNAGIYVGSSLDNSTEWAKGWAENIQVNLRAPADLCRHAIRHFQSQGGGIIVNMASRSSHRGDGPEHLAYGAAKGGLLALTKGIARGYAHENILAYAIAPGWVRTAMADDHIATVGEDAVTSALPMREVTPPGDVANMVAFCASGKCRHATGSTIDITGADYVR
jgi:3-oxoacyl-[acyl-carrier protein] reductase